MPKLTQEQKELRDLHTWGYFSGLQLAEYSLGQLEADRLIFKQERRSANQTRKYILNMLNRGYKQAKASRNDVEFAENFQSNTLAAMVEAIAYINQVPHTQIDWMVEQINKLTYAALNREKVAQKLENNG